MRHPDHNFFENAGDMTFYWAHHEKFVVIDYDTAFIGGLDLCFGRADFRSHPLACVHPGGVQYEIFPGQDFNNNRVKDFSNVDSWKKNEVSKAEYGRMPWHDIHMGLVGPSVYDIAEHFILRWNFCKRDKYKRDDEYDWLTMTGRTGEDEDLVAVQRPKHPCGDYVHHPLSPLENKRGNPDQSIHDGGKHEFSTPERPEVFHDAPEEVDEHGYLPEQHKRGHGLQKDFRQYSQRHHIPHLHKENNEPAGEHQENPKHTGNDPKKEGMSSASGGHAEKAKGYSSDVVGEGVVHAQGTVHAQLVRSSADWSSGILTEQSIQTAYCQVIREAKHFVYIENQFFITATGDKQPPIHNRIGAAIVDACVNAAKEGRKFKVIILIPCIPGFAGDLRSDDAAGTRAIMHYQYQSICRGEHSIFGRIKAAGYDPTQYIFVFNLRSYDRINFTPTLAEREKKSGVKYVEVQRAHAEETMTTGLHHTSKEARDEVKISDQAKKERDEVIARRKLFEGDSGMTDPQEKSGDPDSPEMGHDPTTLSRDTISQDSLLGEKRVSDEAWAGRDKDGKPQDGPEAEDLRETEVQHFVQEELYIHAKVSCHDLCVFLSQANRAATHR